MAESDIRKGMPPVKLARAEFEERYRRRFIDPVFEPLRSELDAIIGAAWDAYSNSRKSPRTRKAGKGFAVDILDLSRTTSEFARQIHPCKSCVSTSMALCHWPCSCYPNY